MTHSTWNDDQLFRYLDDELLESEREALVNDLLCDASLRERFDRLRSLDELGKAALLGPADAARIRQPIMPHLARNVLLAAACAALLVGGFMVFNPSRPPTAAPLSPVVIENLETPSRYSRDVLLLTVPVALTYSVQTATPIQDDESTTDIERSLREGRADEALRALAAFPVLERSDEWTRLGGMMRSADVARSAIMLLPLEQQVEIVRVWSAEPTLRPVVFERLEQLLREPESAAAARTLRQELAQQPHLQSWVSSYAAAP